MANAADPNVVDVRGVLRPLALVHGELAAGWVERLVPDADDALRLAAPADCGISRAGAGGAAGSAGTP